MISLKRKFAIARKSDPLFDRYYWSVEERDWVRLDKATIFESIPNKDIIPDGNYVAVWVD